MNKKGFVLGSSPVPYNKQDSRDIGLVILFGLLLVTMVFTFGFNFYLGIINVLIAVVLLVFIIKSQRALIKK